MAEGLGVVDEPERRRVPNWSVHPTRVALDPPHLPFRSSPLSSPLGRNGWNAQATPLMVFLEKLEGFETLRDAPRLFAKVDVEGSNPFSRSKKS